jgi:hypothetical protein
MSMQKTTCATKWQPKRAMWITATRHRPITRFLHACGSVSGQMRRWPCGRVGVRVCMHVCGWCASVRVCEYAEKVTVTVCVGACVRVCMVRTCLLFCTMHGWLLYTWCMINGTHFLTFLGVSAILLVFVSRIAFSGATDVLGTSVCRLAMHHITGT